MSPEYCLVVRKGSGGKRQGRGFSQGELKKAGASVGQALRAKLPVDLRRRSVYEENVKLVTQKLERLGAPKKRRPKPKKS